MNSNKNLVSSVMVSQNFIIQILKMTGHTKRQPKIKILYSKK
jgi:hypothetical protein